MSRSGTATLTVEDVEEHDRCARYDEILIVKPMTLSPLSSSTAEAQAQRRTATTGRTRGMAMLPRTNRRPASARQRWQPRRSEPSAHQRPKPRTEGWWPKRQIWNGVSLRWDQSRFASVGGASDAMAEPSGERQDPRGGHHPGSDEKRCPGLTSLRVLLQRTHDSRNASFRSLSAAWAKAICPPTVRGRGCPGTRHTFDQVRQGCICFGQSPTKVELSCQ